MSVPNRSFASFMHTGALRARCRLASFVLGFSIAVSGCNQRPNGREIGVSGKTVANAMGTIRAHADAKRYDAAIANIDGLLAVVADQSYDAAVLWRTKAAILLKKGDYANSIQPLEKALDLANQYGFFDPDEQQQLRYYLSQLYYQEAPTTRDLESRKILYAKAVSVMEAWSRENGVPKPDAQLFYASLLYNMAQLDPKNVDMMLVKRAQEEVEKGLTMSLKPKDAFYILLLATLQQQGETERSAEILELLVKKDPKNRIYWAQLASSYLYLKQDLRAALTIERMPPRQELRNTDQEIEALEKGLRDGTIDSTQRNWEGLAALLQMVRRDLEATEVLKKAIKAFPDSGSLYLQLATVYYSLDKLDDAYIYAKQSVSKKLEKSWRALTFLAYICYELKRYDEGLEAINRALEHPEGKEESKRLKKAIEDAIKNRGAVIQPPAP